MAENVECRKIFGRNNCNSRNTVMVQSNYRESACVYLKVTLAELVSTTMRHHLARRCSLTEVEPGLIFLLEPSAPHHVTGLIEMKEEAYKLVNVDANNA